VVILHHGKNVPQEVLLLLSEKEEEEEQLNPLLR
jgi:hypothetical protein